MKLKKCLKEKDLRYLKLLSSLKTYNYFKNMADEKIRQEIRLKNIDETRSYLIEEKN